MSEDVVGTLSVVRVDPESLGKGPFFPVFRDGVIKTIELVEPQGQASESATRLGEEGVAVAAGPASDEIKDAIAKFGSEFSRRIGAVHQVMRLLGLTPPDLQQGPGRLIEVNGKVAKFSLSNAEGRDVTIEILRNGNIFLDRRRYDPAISKVVLTDGEILQNGVVTVEVDPKRNVIIATFMTVDGRPAHLSLDSARPLEPVIEGKIPESTIKAMQSRPDAVTLGALARLCIERITEAKENGGPILRLFSGRARLAHADLLVLTDYVAGNISAASDGANWGQSASVMPRVAEAVVRRLPNEGLKGDGAYLRWALVAIGVGHALGAAKAK